MEREVSVTAEVTALRGDYPATLLLASLRMKNKRPLQQFPENSVWY